MATAATTIGVREVSAPEGMTRRPRVSVLTITYNHAPYVAECIDSAMRQQTDFPIEMVIGEDASPDRTREICQGYQARFPDRIRLLLPAANIGRHANFLNTFRACRGEYIALLEGDDFWIDPHKLQRQVDLLDRHPEWSACFHNVRIVGEFEPDEGRLYFPAPPKAVWTLDDLIVQNFIPTCSCMFRAGLFAAFPDWYADAARAPYADWILHALNARRGAIGYIDAVMATYRRHAVGVWGRTFDGSLEGEIRRMRDRLVTYRGLRACLGRAWAAKIRRQMAVERFHIGLAYRAGGHRWTALRHLAAAGLTARVPEAPVFKALVATALFGAAAGRARSPAS